MEGSVEAGKLRQAGPKAREFGNRCQACWLVKRCKRGQGFKLRENAGIDANRFAELNTAMDNAVPNGLQRYLAQMVVTRAGAALARSFIAGTVSGFAGSVENSFGDLSTSALGSVRSLDTGQAVKAGVASGLSKSSDKLTDFYLDLARQAGPIVEVGAAKDVVVVIQEGVTLEIKPTAGSKF
jgi:hypothetical protein